MFKYRNDSDSDGDNDGLWHSSYPYIIIHLNLHAYGLLKSKLNLTVTFWLLQGSVKIASIQLTNLPVSISCCQNKSSLWNCGAAHKVWNIIECAGSCPSRRSVGGQQTPHHGYVWAKGFQGKWLARSLRCLSRNQICAASHLFFWLPKRELVWKWREIVRFKMKFPQEFLCETPGTGFQESAELLRVWICETGKSKG